MQKTKKQTKPQKPVETYPAVDDFFTQFLDKKKRNYTKKLDKIETLQKKKIEELTPEQKDLVNNRQKVVDKAEYYEDIKKLYFKANSKRDGAKTCKDDMSNCIHSTVSLYYLGNCAKESGETAMRVLGNYGVDFQEKIHRYHNRVFNADCHNTEELKKAEEGLNEYLKDSETAKIAGDILKDGKLCQTQEVQPPVHKESISKPQLFAMSSEDEEEEETQPVKQEKAQEPLKQQNNESAEFKPTFVALPEDDNEEGFAFESGQRSGGRGRGRKPRGDRPYKKYDGERREPRERKEFTEDAEGQDKEGDETNERPRGRGRGFRGRNPDKEHEENRERGDRRKPYGRGRGKHFNKDKRDDRDYQKKEVNTERQVE